MSSRDLSALDRDMFQPLGRIIQEAFRDGIQRVIPADATGLATGLALYPSVSGAPAITEYAGIFLYQGDAGSVINYSYGLMLGMKVNNAPTYGAHFIRAYSHGSAPVDSFLYYQNSGADKLTHLIKAEAIVAPFSTGDPTGGGGAANAMIKCKIGATTCYIALYY